MTANADKDTARMHVKRLGRELAMQFLFQRSFSAEAKPLDGWEEFLGQAGNEHGLKDNRFARKGGEYARRLVEGIFARLPDIDAVINEKAQKWDLNRMALVDRNILRVAAYEMLYVPEVPPIVSINEAVEIARDYSGRKAGNFINGVLNGIKDGLNRPAREAVDKL
ncbi:MAG: transcription antitermination factor NusB [Victivallaceae bacterium]|nr:transcription antitermination factor NusB [Victivallaceae bacterium]